MGSDAEKIVAVQQMARMITENPELPVYYRTFPAIRFAPKDREDFNIGQVFKTNIQKICLDLSPQKETHRAFFYDNSLASMVATLEGIHGKASTRQLTVKQIEQDYEALDWKDCIVVYIGSIH